MVEQVGAGDETGAGLVLPAADLHRLVHQPRLGIREHRSSAQGLLDRRGEIRVAVVRVDLAHESVEHRGLAGQPLECPRELGGGRLMAGHEQRHQLVAKLGVGHG